MRGCLALAVGAALLLRLRLAAIEPRAWLTLTVAGLAMGMLIFLVASGLTLIFGLMDVLNFAHGALFSWGAYAGFTVAVAINGRWGWAASPSIWRNAGLLMLAVAAAVAVAFTLGVVLERVIVRPVYGQHLFQILITLGATIVLEELIRVAWGPNDQVMPVPATFQGSWDVADVVVLRFPAIAIGLGLLVYGSMQWVLTRTRVGLIVRAGVENREMVQVMGHDIHRYFTAVFAAGSGLAGLGGLMWGMFSQSIRPSMGGEQLIFAFIVVIIGGLGSVPASPVPPPLLRLPHHSLAYPVPPPPLRIPIG